MFNFPKLIILIMLTGLVAAPVFAQKKKSKGKKGFVSRTFHDLTAKYNGYFNGKLKLQGIKQTLATTQQDNYEEILPVYKTGSEQDANSINADADLVIKKGSYVIQKHPESKWVDNSYLLIGQAQYLKRNYEEAIGTFQYIISEFKEAPEKKAPPKKKKKKRKSPSKKKKKKTVKKKSSAPAKTLIKEKEEKEDRNFFDLFRHKPVTYPAMVSLINSYTDLGKYEEAQTLISLASVDEKFPEKLYSDLAAAQAHLLLSRKQYSAAIDPLIEAIEFCRKKKTRARYTFILAQLYQQTGDNDLAAETYEQVIEMDPDYIMEFNAKLALVQTYQTGQKGSAENIERLLTRMLLDEKFEEFKDRIYFALAELAMKQNDIDKAIKNYKLSAQHNSVKNNQKYAAYQKLAELYFNREDYFLSKSYYDSTIAVIKNDHPQFSAISLRKDILTDLVVHLTTIEREDSLQALAKMSQKDRDKKVYELYQEYLNKLKTDSANTPVATTNNILPPSPIGPAAQAGAIMKGAWYFYNPALKGSGFTEFKTRWGNRPLEDNWRRSNKKSLNPVNDFGGENQLADNIVNNNMLNKADLYKNIPLTDEAMILSNDRMIQAYYAAGSIFKDRLNNYPKAISTYEAMLRKFPSNDRAAETYYQLYTANNRINQASRSGFYRDKVLSEYPNSTFASLIKDPNYQSQSQQKNKEIESYYEETFKLYTQERHFETLARIQAAEAKFGNNPLTPKFELLKAIVTGKTQDKEMFKESLREIIKKYPKDEVKIKAEEILKYLESKSPANPITDPTSKYKVEPEDKHYFILLLKNDIAAKNKLKSALADFNTLNYSLDELEVSEMMIDPKTFFIVVKDFDKGPIAMNYFNNINFDKNIFTGIKKENYNLFVITKDNYNRLVKDKDTAGYLDFFTKNYLK